MEEKLTIVIGASLNPARFSNLAVKKFVLYRIPVIAIGIKQGEIYGVRIHDTPPPLDKAHTITMYIGKAHQDHYRDFIKNLHPSRVIFNPGAENEEFEQELSAMGTEVLKGCTLMMLDHGTY